MLQQPMQTDTVLLHDGGKVFICQFYDAWSQFWKALSDAFCSYCGMSSTDTFCIRTNFMPGVQQSHMYN